MPPDHLKLPSHFASFTQLLCLNNDDDNKPISAILSSYGIESWPTELIVLSTVEALYYGQSAVTDKDKIPDL